jgi:hypothetical protein
MALDGQIGQCVALYVATVGVAGIGQQAVGDLVVSRDVDLDDVADRSINGTEKMISPRNISSDGSALKAF